MIVTKDTKISKIIKANEKSIDTIASINKHFLKLKNPILRRVLASRVSVKEASKIGKTTVNAFLEKLENIGFEVIYENDVIINEITNTSEHQTTAKVISLDVRPTIESGADPFKEIMQAIKVLKQEEALKIINIFEPIPLINILKSKGFKTWTEVISENEYHTYFEKEFKASNLTEISSIVKGDFNQKLIGFGGNIKEIDVRTLEMPEPMVTILSELEKLPNDYALLVNHKKIPQFLLAELKLRNYQWLHKDIEPGYILFLIFTK